MSEFFKMQKFQMPKKPMLSDFSASLVVFLVALPLCMGISLASGVPPIYGIITGIVGGIVVGLLTGSQLQVSGPAAGLTVLVWEFVEKYGLEALGLVVLTAGLIQLLCGQLRLGQWFRAASPAIIQGMLTGIGILILSSQFHVMIDDKPKGNGLDNLLSIPQSIWKGLVPMDGTAHHIAAALGVSTIILILLWQGLAPKKFKFIPAPLFAIGLVTICAYWFQLPINYVEIPQNALTAIPWPPAFFEQYHLLSDGQVWFEILGLAFIASAETLLSTSAVDKMHTGPRADYDKELSAQGVGNMLCGVLGVLPLTGVIVRSAANVHAGAVSNKSAIFHGVWLLLFVVFAEPILNLIPTSALAAILVFTGYKLMNFKIIPELLKHGKGEVLIFGVTIVTIVAEDLLTGILVGLVLSIAKLIYVFSQLSIHTIYDSDDDITHVYLEGAATFIRLPQLASIFEKMPSQGKVVVHIHELSYIDHACFELFRDWENQHFPDEGGGITIDWETKKNDARFIRRISR
jgi:MFS superfamily sulfate permease-like transporter